MIEEKKQPDKTSEHLEENSKLSEELENGNSMDREENLSTDGDNKRVSTEPLTTATSEVSPQEAQIDDEKETNSVIEESSVDRQSEQVIEALQGQIAVLKQQSQQQASEFDLVKAQYRRLAADFDNLRKRMQKEKEELEHLVKRNTIAELLSVIDNFERARMQIKPNNDGEMAIHKSYQGVYKQLVDALKRLGVSAMRPEGKQFDPNFHEAVFREPTDEYPEGAVIEQFQRGYLLGDRVLRHAMVKVAAPKEPVVTSEEETSASVEATDTTDN